MSNNNKVEFPSRYRQNRYEDNLKKVGRFTSKIANGIVLVAFIALIALSYYPIVKGFASTDQPIQKVTAPAEQAQKIVKIKVIWTEERIIEEIKNTFPDAPIMLAVAKCEGSVGGRLNQDAFNPTNGSNDQGIFQISEMYHKETYTALGFTDMTDVTQNLAYARILFDKNGLRDWEASREVCWG